MPDNGLILVVDDDPSVVASLRLLLKQRGHATAAAAGPAEALEQLRRREVSLVLQDMNFTPGTSGREGLALLDGIRQERPDVPVVLITAWGSIELAVQGMKRGAADFVTKPWSNDALMAAVETALGVQEARLAVRQRVAPPSRAELDASYDLGGILGRSPRLLRVLELVGRVAATDASVLVTGESGTGKELVAEALHRNSRRRGGPFVKVNLGGISSTLFESEMFGHLRGAFTDARADRRGRFELAQGGTIFLDEVGELEPGSQVKLLRVLQDRTYEILGSSVPRTVDVRIVSATNRDLARQVAEGSFREDLLYRLNLITLHLPPLRERREDVPPLAESFLAAAARSYGRPGLSLAPSAIAWLQAQAWPGNVRQLRQLVERAVLVLRGDRVEAEDLAHVSADDPGAPAAPTARGPRTLEAVEREMVVDALERHAGNISRAADDLGLSRAALYRRLRKHGLAAPGGDDELDGDD